MILAPVLSKELRINDEKLVVLPKTKPNTLIFHR